MNTKKDCEVIDLISISNKNDKIGKNAQETTKICLKLRVPNNVHFGTRPQDLDGRRNNMDS